MLFFVLDFLMCCIFVCVCVCLQVMQLQKESGTAEEHSLDKEARKWSSRVAREYKCIIHTQRVRNMTESRHGCFFLDLDFQINIEKASI